MYEFSCTNLLGELLDIYHIIFINFVIITWQLVYDKTNKTIIYATLHTASANI